MGRITLVRCSCLLSVAVLRGAAPLTADFVKARDEAVAMLQGLVRIDTSNPLWPRACPIAGVPITSAGL